MRLIFLLGVFALLAGWARAAETTAADLGEGLAYARVNNVSVQTLPALDGPLVLDLRRCAPPSDEAASALGGFLRGAGPLRLVLVSRETPAALRSLLAQRAPNVITLAASGSAGEPAPDIVVAATPEEDLRAYDALTTGAELAKLVQPPLQKPRRDEASIVRSRANGANGAATTNGSNGSEEETPSTDANPPEPAEPLLVDLVLQRAVHVHRGLKALGRVP